MTFLSVPKGRMVLKEDEVHVWRASLELKKRRLRSLEQTLSPDEFARAERFRFIKDRDNYIAARGLLRTLICHYLRDEPVRVRFSYGQFGKPEIAHRTPKSLLRFNISYSCGVALFAFTLNRDIGVDIEHIRSDLPYKDIAEEFFTPNEVAALKMFPAAMRQEAFFSLWTCKEAHLKAEGYGLLRGLDRTEISLLPSGPAIQEIGGDQETSSLWSLYDLCPGDGFAAALAVKGSDLQIQTLQWDDMRAMGCPRRFLARKLQ